MSLVCVGFRSMGACEGNMELDEGQEYTWIRVLMTSSGLVAMDADTPAQTPENACIGPLYRTRSASSTMLRRFCRTLPYVAHLSTSSEHGCSGFVTISVGPCCQYRGALVYEWLKACAMFTRAGLERAPATRTTLCSRTAATPITLPKAKRVRLFLK